MMEFEKVLLEERPDLIIVPGDVNSTMACSLVASKLGIRIAHVESGLRSFDRSMPEEINRIITDAISDLLFISEPSGLKNLRSEGISEEKIFFTGNVMIDSLIHYMPKIADSEIHSSLNLKPNDYMLVTFHRPANVDEREGLSNLVDYLNKWTLFKQLIFPVHPRTKRNLEEFGLLKNFNSRIQLTEPIGYIDFLSLTRKATMVITDSGGIQEETTFLSVPCITVRNSTERPVTVDEGTNYLAGTQLDNVTEHIENILKGNFKKGKIPEHWDGKTSERIVDIVNEYLNHLP
jgi:UDP-N-acetylglucosamine 2-epimerase (non-hydrolysing)